MLAESHKKLTYTINIPILGFHTQVFMYIFNDTWHRTSNLISCHKFHFDYESENRFVRASVVCKCVPIYLLCVVNTSGYFFKIFLCVLVLLIFYKSTISISKRFTTTILNKLKISRLFYFFNTNYSTKPLNVFWKLSCYLSIKPNQYWSKSGWINILLNRL